MRMALLAMMVAALASASVRCKGKPLPVPAMPGKNVSAIKVNTVGYATGWKKIAVFNVDPKGAVVKASSGRIAHRFRPQDIEDRGIEAASKDRVWQGDFSSLNAAGRYIIAVGEHHSEPFEIGGAPYRGVLAAALKQFFYQRCRTALTEPYARSFTRGAPCHVHDEVAWDLADHPERKRRWKVRQGWHDAGNYDMYVASTAPTAQALLLAFETEPELFGDLSLDIPESSNGVPDILDEVRWALEWVIAMQEPRGAFRAREAVHDLSDAGPPDRDRRPRWIAGIGTASTGKAVAVLAQAARLFTRFDPKFAARCGEAARLGWKFLVSHPKQIFVDGKGSRQPLWDDGPEYSDVGARFVAAVEIWRTFRGNDARRSIESLLTRPETGGHRLLSAAWGNVSRLGLVSLLNDDAASSELAREAKDRIVASVAPFRKRVERTDGYRCASAVGDYYWGHNSNLMEKAHQLLVAFRHSREDWLLDAARDQWHWLLGRNPNGYSMVTSVGKSPERIYHHEWMGGVRRMPPGYLVGGPNAADLGFLAPGAPAKALLWDNAKTLRSGLPPHSLWHNAQSDLWDGGFLRSGDWTKGWWAVNEPDIYYNANLVLVAAQMQGD
jgi:endoglucanase